MSNPYREYQLYKNSENTRKVYKYILRDKENCPLCKKRVSDEILSFTGEWISNPRYKICHPLKRICIEGMWWWKKYCPVEGVHKHIHCKECSISWISMHPDQSEANPNVQEVYL